MRFAHFAKGRPTRKEAAARCRRHGSDIFATRLARHELLLRPRRRGRSDLDRIGHGRTSDLANAPASGTSPSGERLYLRSSTSICRNSLKRCEFSDDSRFGRPFSVTSTHRLEAPDENVFPFCAPNSTNTVASPVRRRSKSTSIRTRPFGSPMLSSIAGFQNSRDLHESLNAWGRPVAAGHKSGREGLS